MICRASFLLLPLVAVTASLAFDTGTARAGDEEEVVAHVRAARDAAAAGDHKTAVKEYQAGFAIVPNPSLLIAIAIEYRDLGNGHNARKYLRRFLKEAPSDHKKRGEAKALLAQLEAEKSGRTESEAEDDGGGKSGAAPAPAPAPAPVSAPAPAPEPGAGKEAAPAGENEAAAATEFAPESIPLQLEDGEKPVERRSRLRRTVDVASTAPVAAPPPEAPEGPFYRKWWFWTMVAVVVGGTVALAVTATRSGSQSIHPCPSDVVVGCYGDGRR